MEKCAACVILLECIAGGFASSACETGQACAIDQPELAEQASLSLVQVGISLPHQKESLKPRLPETVKQVGYLGHYCNDTRKSLVYDIGLHNGLDTATYLNMGYCVVAVEANPILVAAASKKFSDAIGQGRLVILNIGVGTFDRIHQPLPFWVNKIHNDWSSFDRNVGCRATAMEQIDAGLCEEVRMPVINCGDVLETFGVPLYLKIDINGGDNDCLTSLINKGHGNIPTYVSAEIQRDEIPLMYAAGYRSFKLVDQSILQPIGGSGPFGEEAVDVKQGRQWRTYDGMLHDHGFKPNGWFDWHAKVD